MKEIFIVIILILIKFSNSKAQTFNYPNNKDANGNYINIADWNDTDVRMGLTISYNVIVKKRLRNYSLHTEDEGLNNPKNNNNGLKSALSVLTDEIGLSYAGRFGLWNVKKEVDAETGIINIYRTDSTVFLTAQKEPISANAQYRRSSNAITKWQQYKTTTNNIAEQAGNKKGYMCTESSHLSGSGYDSTSRADGMDNKYLYAYQYFNPKIRYNPKNGRAELTDCFLPVRINNLDTLDHASKIVKDGDRDNCEHSQLSSDGTEELKQKMEAMVTIANNWTKLYNSENAITDEEIRIPAYKPLESYTNTGEFLLNAPLTSLKLDFNKLGKNNSAFNGGYEGVLKLYEKKNDQINPDAYYQNVYEDEIVSISVYFRIEIFSAGIITLSRDTDYLDRVNKPDKNPLDASGYYEGRESLPKWVLEQFGL